VIGLAMHLIYRKEEAARDTPGGFFLGDDDHERPLWQTILYFAAMIGILVFANWKALDATGIGAFVASVKWIVTLARCWSVCCSCWVPGSQRTN
jgi:hypothetical protein